MKRAARVCPERGCTTLIRGSARYCPQHTKEHRNDDYDARRPSSGERGYDSKWQAIRAKYLKEHPYCVVCGQPATEVDHIIPLRQGGTHDWDNLRAMCKPHHSQHTAKHGGGFGNREGASQSLDPNFS